MFTSYIKVLDDPFFQKPDYTWQFFAFLISRKKARNFLNLSRKSEKNARKF